MFVVDAGPSDCRKLWGEVEATILWAILGHALLVFATATPLAAELRIFNDDMFLYSITDNARHMSMRHLGARRKATVTCAQLAHTWAVKEDETIGRCPGPTNHQYMPERHLWIL